MHPPTALSLSLAACDSLIDEDLDLNPTVLAPPSSILVRGRRLEFAHCARCHDTPHRHGALPHQIADYGLGAIFTQFLIHGRSACRVGEALHLNDVPVKAGGRFRQLFQLLLVLIRDRGAAHFEFYGCLSLHIVVVEPVEAISVLLDVINDIQENTDRFNRLDDYDVKAEATVKFKVSSSTISNEDKEELKKLAETATGLNGYIVEVKGFADSTGRAAMNEKLSEDRAKAVVGYLMRECTVPVWRIVAPGAMGEFQPAATNENAAGRGENRRVEVKVLINKGIASSQR